MADNDPSNTNRQQASMNLPTILEREANRVVSDQYNKLYAEASAVGGSEGLKHLSRGYRTAIDQGYEVIDERNAELTNATDLSDEPRSVKRNRMKHINDDAESREFFLIPSPFRDDVFNTLLLISRDVATDGRSAANRALSFGAALNKVPAPIWTKHKPVVPNIQVAEPGEMGDPKLPSINEHLARLSATEPQHANMGFGK